MGCLTLADGRTLDYQVRQSARAKYMRMHLSAEKGLVVTQPPGVSTRQLQQWISSQTDWITTHLPKVEAQAEARRQPLSLPDSMHFPSTGENLKVIYKAADNNGISWSYHAHDALHLNGAIEDTAFCCQVLQKWLQGYARRHLGRLLKQAAQETGLRYDSYRVKGQATRWGSCSARSNINLNYKLMLLPAEWVRYTLIHELCHTVEMNHSVRFWTLVEQFMPDYKVIHAQMKTAMNQLPAWVNAK